MLAPLGPHKSAAPCICQRPVRHRPWKVLPRFALPAAGACEPNETRALVQVPRKPRAHRARSRTFLGAAPPLVDERAWPGRKCICPVLGVQDPAEYERAREWSCKIWRNACQRPCGRAKPGGTRVRWHVVVQNLAERTSAVRWPCRNQRNARPPADGRARSRGSAARLRSVVRTRPAAVQVSESTHGADVTSEISPDSQAVPPALASRA
jgi:hypothetical protein